MSDSKSKKLPSVLLVVMAVLLLMTSVIIFSFLPSGSLVINDHRVSVVRADSSSEREQGLSGRESLGENDGMLFVFDSPSPYCFWMKDMKFPIDMIWLDANKKVVSVRSNVTPESYPETFCPNQDAVYVLEVNAGKAEAWGVKAGERAQF